jgi:glycosyltransferase involved in cell wall biosynthesis
MRILFVIRTLNPAWGGPVEGLRNLTTQAMRRGYEVEVACSDEPASSWLSRWDLKAHALGSGSLKRYGFNSALDAWLADNLSRFDAVVVHSVWMYFSYAVWKATRRTGTPYFLFIHGALDPWFRRAYPLKHIKKIVYWKLFEHKVLRDAERVLFTTEEEMMLAERAFLPWECRPAVTGYGIVRPTLPEPFDRARHIQTLTEAHPALAGRNFFLFLARVQEKKGIDLLLKAFASSKEAFPGTALVIAGPGDEKTFDTLKRLASTLGIAGDVVWTGPLYGDDKWNAMRAAEVYVLTSHQENFGISVVEALACGVPVLVSDKVNIWREIRAANAGMVAPDDVAGATRLLTEWAATSLEAKAEMRLNAINCFARNFDITVTGDRFFALLRSGGAVRLPIQQRVPASPAA